MAINPVTGKNMPPITSNVTGKEKKPATPSSRPESNKIGNDSFDPTAISQKIRQALENEPSTSVMNEEKIAAVRDALKQGNYQIDADSIAEKMLQFDNPFNSA